MGAIAGILGQIPENTEKISKSLLWRARHGVEQILLPEGMLFHGIKNQKTAHCIQEKIGRETYSLVFSGSLFNREELEDKLHQKGLTDGSLLLRAYLTWGRECAANLNGVFAMAVYEEKSRKLLLFRDPMGVQPLFYRLTGKGILFASEIKTILAFPGSQAGLDRRGAMELIMLGPGRLPGSGVFRDICELKPGFMAVYKDGKLQTEAYWHLKDGEHRETFEETADHVRYLVRDAVRRQRNTVEDCGTFLSGGLDSSILSAVCAEDRETSPLKTYSVDYFENDRFFIPGKFQPDSDGDYIARMREYLHSSHREVILKPEDLLDQLEQATIARDLPGMGDVDFSLLAFCREVRKTVPAVLSGECADEIFGGYPWYRDPEIRSCQGFPWAQNTFLRRSLMADPPGDAEDFVLHVCRESEKEADIRLECSREDREIKKMMYLNMTWFMQTLTERNDRMSAAADLQVLVPFCDVRIAEYLYKVPWNMKNFQGREKGLLRYAAKDLLPEAVRLRKKSPYPKTFDPAYGNLVIQKLRDLLVEEEPIWYVVSRKTAGELLAQEAAAPWYGQLMRRPQFAAWLLQMNFWLKNYNVELFF